MAGASIHGTAYGRRSAAQPSPTLPQFHHHVPLVPLFPSCSPFHRVLPPTTSATRRGGALAAGDGEAAGASDGDDGEEEEEDAEEAAAAAEAARNDPRAVAKREKISSLWEQINSKAAANGTGSAAGRLPSAGVTLAGLCTSATAEQLRAKRARKAAPDEVGNRRGGKAGSGPQARFQ